MRNGDRSELFSSEHLNELILKGTNQAWDSLVSGISMDRASFTVLRAGCALRTGYDIDDADLVSAYQRNMLAPHPSQTSECGKARGEIPVAPRKRWRHQARTEERLPHEGAPSVRKEDVYAT